MFDEMTTFISANVRYVAHAIGDLELTCVVVEDIESVSGSSLVFL